MKNIIWYLKRFIIDKLKVNKLKKYYSRNNKLLGLKTKTIIYMADGKMLHGGLQDRLCGIISTYDYCKKNGIGFKIHFNSPYNLTDYLLPNRYDWTIDESQISFNLKESEPVYIPYYPEKKIVLGWVGSPSTIRYIEDLFPVFKKVNEKYPFFQVNIIGIENKYIQYPFIKTIPWSKETEVDEISKFSLGVMPQYDSPFEKGKYSYKLIKYMRCYKACIASPIGSNNQVITDSWNGNFAHSGQEWFDCIESFILDKNRIIEFGKNGRKRVEEVYNVSTNIQKINDVFFNFIKKNARK